MPTPAEQKALAFVALVVLLGGAVRVVRGGALGPQKPSVDEQQALARQTFAASSSAAVQSSGKGSAGRKGRKVSRIAGDTGAKNRSAGELGVARDWRGLPPPSPRIDIGARPLQAGPEVVRAMRQLVRSQAGPIDLDTATEAEIEALPRVGPSLARRIVAQRDSAGPFGTLDALRRVRGVGPATLKLLAPLVTFSGQTRR